MENWLNVAHLDVERLLADWRWLIPESMALVARNAFGDLFLRNQSGNIFRLDTAVGKLTKVADSENEFREQATSEPLREEWFVEVDERGFAAHGLIPNETQCIGFDIPLVFAEGTRKPYVADLYEYVSFLGDLCRQISDVPDGGKVRLHHTAKPTDSPH